MTDWYKCWRFDRVDKFGTGVTVGCIKQLSCGGFVFHTCSSNGEVDGWLELEEALVAALKNYIFDNHSLVEKRSERAVPLFLRRTP